MLYLLMANKQTKKPFKQSDAFLKAAFEENFVDFLRFLYPEADDIFDFTRDIEFMDKELLSIIPDRDRKKGKRVADLLAKVFLKDGTAKYILLNIEIEGGSDAAFAERIYIYNYRILDRYHISVATIVVYTGDHRQPRPSEYRSEILDTSLTFKFRAFHILDYTEGELLAMNNIFALVVLACQKSLLENKLGDRELGDERLMIAKALLQHNYDRDRIMNFLVFLKNFLYIGDAEINSIFDKELTELSGGTINMGTIEILKKQEREQGIKQGLKQGLEQGKQVERAKAEAEKKASAIKMLQSGFDSKMISDILNFPIKEIEKLK